MTRRRIWAVGLTLAASLAQAAPAAAEAGPHAGRVAYTDGARLLLRATPDPAGPIVKRLEPGSRLMVLDVGGTPGRWLRVEHAGTVSYAAADYIALDDEPTGSDGRSVAEAWRPGRVVNTKGAALRVRAAPDEGAPILKRLAPGARLTLVGLPTRGGRWQRIEYDGVAGYVATAYVAAMPRPGAATDAAVGAKTRRGWIADTDGGNTPLRVWPSTGAPAIKALGPGWRVTILGELVAGDDGRSWARVEHVGATGYLPGEALMIAGGAPPNPVSTPAAVDNAAGPMTWPTRGRITTYFTFAGRGGHNGLDIANAVGTPIVAADGGVVTWAGWRNNGLGVAVYVDHGNGLQTLYGHLASAAVARGQRVSRGEVIGSMGSTGKSTGSHLHFVVVVGGGYRDPLGFLP